MHLIEMGCTHWRKLRVRFHGPISKKINLQSLWTPHWASTECGPRGMTMHQKIECVNFFNICPKREN